MKVVRMKSTSNPYFDIKIDNRNRIFNLIRETENVSKPSVPRKLGISIPTANQHIKELEELGCIREGENLGQTGGRRAKSYSVNEEFRYAIGAYIFAEKLIVTATDFAANQLPTVIEQCVFKLENSYYRKFAELVESYIDKYIIDREKILGVGIALPALITEDHQWVYYGKPFGFTGMSAQDIGKYLSYPCRLYNAADAAGFAEIAQYGEKNDAFYISLGESIGGTVLIDGKIYGGQNAKSGKIAHLMIVPGGEKCYCGRKGCFDTVCNAGVLRKACGGDVDDFFKMLRDGDSICTEEWEKYLRYLAEGIVDVRMLFDSKIILGGIVSEYMEPYFEELLEYATELDTFDNPADYLQLSCAKKGGAAFGSALPFVHECWQKIF